MNYLIKAWHSFWFERDSALSIAVFRILYGFMVLQFAWLIFPDLETWYGSHSWLNPNSMMLMENSARFSLFYLLPDNVLYVKAVLMILVLSACSLIIGFKSRISAAIVFVTLLSFHHYNILILHSGDTLMRLMAYYLIWSQSGKALSVDNLRALKSESLRSRLFGKDCSHWAQRLMQIQIAAVYCQSFFSKLAGDSWWNGTAVYYALHLQEFQRFAFIPFADNLLFCKILTWATLLTELSLWTLIWFKKFRYPVLLLGVVFHLCVDFSMNIPQFEYMMIISYILFIDGQDMKKLFQFLFDMFKSFRRRLHSAG